MDYHRPHNSSSTAVPGNEEGAQEEQVLAGRYVLKEELGAGAEGRVYRALDQIGGRELAIKRPHRLRSGVVAAMRRQYSRLAEVRHPHVARVHDYGKTDAGLPFFVMEILPGAEALPELFGGDLGPILVAAAQVAGALDALHGAGLVHGDLKPENILWIPGERPRAVLADLGLARNLGPQSVVSGTPEYMAPEVVQGLGADGRADFYSLGITLFEWIAGRRPFAGSTHVEVMRAQVEDPVPSLRSLAPDVPEILSELVARLLEKDPQARLRSGCELIDALAASAEVLGLPGHVPPPQQLRGLFRGRQKELIRLRRCWARARRRKRTTTLLLSGEPGSGKSRLLDELEWRARGAAAWVGRADCDPEDPRPFGVLADVTAALRARLPAAKLEAWSRSNPGAAALGANGTCLPATLQVGEALQHLLALCPHPCLIIIDQAEHASAACCDALASLAANEARSPALLVVSRGAPREDSRQRPRSGGPPQSEAAEEHWERLAANTEIMELARLTDAGIEEWAQEMLGAQSLSTPFKKLLAAEGRGNPRRVERLLDALDRSGQLTRAGSAWSIEIEGVELDSSGLAIDDRDRVLVEQITQELGATARSVLLHAAVLRHGDARLLSLSTGIAAPLIQLELERFEATGVIALDADFRIPRRELVEEILKTYEPAAVEAARAAAAAALIEETQPNALRVARLALGGKELALATEWVIRALETAAADTSAAAQRALVLGLLDLQAEQNDGIAARAKTLWLAIDFVDGLGDYAGVEALCSDLLALADEMPSETDAGLHRAHGWRWLADSRHMRGERQAAEEAIASGLAALGPHSSAESAESCDERVHLQHLRALALLAHNQAAAARDLLAGEALVLASATPDPAKHRARLHGTLAQARLRLGDLEGAAQANSEALSHHEKVGDLGRAAACYNLYGLLAFSRNAWKAMAANFRKARTCTERIGDMSSALVAMSNVAYAEAEGGNWDEALAMVRRGLVLGERISNQQQLAALQNTAGLVHLWRGDVAAAEKEFGACAERAEEQGFTPAVAVAVGNQGDCALARSALAEAKGLFARAMEISVEHGMIDEQIENGRRLAETVLQLGDERGAWRHGREAYRLARKRGARFEIAQLYRVVGQYHENHECYREAEAAHGRAVKILENLGRRFPAALARHRRGIATARGGDLSVGLEQLAQAEAVFLSFGARSALTQLSNERQSLQDADGAHSRAFRKMEILLDASQAINAAGDIDEMLATVLDGAMEVSEAERGFLVTRKEDGELSFDVGRHRDGGSVSGGDVSRSVVRRAIDEGSSYVNTDLAAEDGSGQVRGAQAGKTMSMLQLELKSVMCVPLRVKDETVGAIYVDNSCTAATSFRDDDLRILKSLASIAATAMERARLYNRLLANYHSMERQKNVLEQAFEQLKTAREGLIQAEKLSTVGLLAAGIAHELKQPLTAIYGGLELLALRELPEPVAKQIRALHGQTQRMNKLVQNMNGYVRQSSGEMLKVDPAKPLNEALDLVSDRLRREQIELNLDLRSLAPIRADESQLQQVFINLITNAADAMEERERRELRIAMSESGGRVQYRISDTGVGIPPERLGTVFKMFETSKPRGKGVGMGLSIVRGIIHEHSGTIDVESVPDEGTTFILTLPCLS